MITNLNNLITTLSNKYSLDIHTDLQEDLLIGDIRITEQGRVILREKSIDLFHMRGGDFFDFLQGTKQEERRLLTDLSCLVRIKKREFQECTGRYVDERKIDYEEEYCRLRIEFNRYVEFKREEGKTNYIIDCARERRIKELEEKNERLKKSFREERPKEDSGNLCAGIVIFLLIVIAVLFCSV